MASPYDELPDFKWNEYEQRCAVVQILCQVWDKFNNKEVSEMVGVSRQRVGELRSALLESREPCAVVDRAKTAQGTTRKVRSGEFVDEMREVFENTPHSSMKDVAREYGVSDWTVRSTVNEGALPCVKEEPGVDGGALLQLLAQNSLATKLARFKSYGLFFLGLP